MSTGGGSASTGETIRWLRDSEEPWTRYRTMVDLLGMPEEASDVRAARVEMLDHPKLREILAQFARWGELPLKRHNDAGHPLTTLSVLADFGVKLGDSCVDKWMGKVLAHQSEEGSFQTLLNIPRAFGGSGEDRWTWISCDAPTLLYVLLSMGLGGDSRVQKALSSLVDGGGENGWGCKASFDLGKFKGPGKRSDPCPIANVLALKALSVVPSMLGSEAARRGTEMLLGHWALRGEKKFFLFGIGTDFSKIKYPFVWYDILHVMDVLSRFPWVHEDPRFQEMLTVLTGQSSASNRYTAASMYRAWKTWSFADKKLPSPWLTFLVLRIKKRVGVLGEDFSW